MFIREDSAATIRNIVWPPSSEFYEVVGEQYRADMVRRMKEAIRGDASFCPHSVLLVEEDDNPHDRNAVAVMYPFAKCLSPSGVPGVEAEVVGYLPRDDAAHFRGSMKRIGVAGRPLEVCGCVVSVSDRPFDGVKVYLPRNFAALVVKGYVDDPANAPAWIADDSPVAAKEAEGDYTPDDLRRIYCRYAQVKAWNSLPYMIEEKLAAWEQGIGPVGLALFHLRTGLDKHSEDGQQALAARAQRVTEESLGKFYDTFDDATPEALNQAFSEAFTAAGEAGVQSPLVAELFVLGQLKALEQKKIRGLATAWGKLRADAKSRLADSAQHDRFTAFAEQKTLLMFQVLLSEAISEALDRADRKASLSEKRTALQAAIDKVAGQSRLLDIPAVGDEVRRFEEYVQAQIAALPTGDKQA